MGYQRKNQERKNDSEEGNDTAENKQHPKITVSFLKLSSYIFRPGISILSLFFTLLRNNLNFRRLQIPSNEGKYKELKELCLKLAGNLECPVCFVGKTTYQKS